jgi:hypothetical protein
MKIKLSTRLVIVFKKFVIKIPIDRRGYLQCKQEKYIYNKYSNCGLLGQLHWYKFGIICMKRYEIASNINPKNVVAIKTIIPEFDFNNCDLFNSKNWGIENGKFLLIDYGVNEKISKMY